MATAQPPLTPQQMIARLGKEEQLRTESSLGRHAMVVKLVKLGKSQIDIDSQDTKTSRTALYLAAEKGNLDIVNTLITAGANVNVIAPLSNNRTPLHIACKSGFVDVAEALLDAGADTELRTSLGYTAMHLAALNNRPKIVKLLISRGADLNARDAGQCTPLYLSAQEGHFQVASLLVKAKCEIDSRRESGCTPLYIAAQKNSLDIMGLLLRSGAAVDAPRDNGCTPLHVACEQGHIDGIKLLVSSGAQVRAASSSGWTALMLAAKKGHSDVLRELLKSEPFFFSADGNRIVFNALCVAAKGGSCESVEVLLDALFLNSSTALSLFSHVGVNSPDDINSISDRDHELATHIYQRRQVGLEACGWMIENCREDGKILQQALETRMDSYLSLFADPKSALKDASKLIEMSSESAADIRSAYYNCRALILLSLQNLEGAISDAHASLNCIQSCLHSALDDPSLELRDDTNSTIVSNFLVITEARLKQGNLKQARIYATKALSRRPPEKQRDWLERVVDMDQETLDRIIVNRREGKPDTELPPKQTPPPAQQPAEQLSGSSSRSKKKKKKAGKRATGSGSSTTSAESEPQPSKETSVRLLADKSIKNMIGKRSSAVRPLPGIGVISELDEDEGSLASPSSSSDLDDTLSTRSGKLESPESIRASESEDSFYTLDDMELEDDEDGPRTRTSMSSISSTSWAESTSTSISSHRSGSSLRSTSSSSVSTSSRTSNRFVLPPAPSRQPAEEKKEQPKNLLVSIAKSGKPTSTPAEPSSRRGEKRQGSARSSVIPAKTSSSSAPGGNRSSSSKTSSTPPAPRKAKSLTTPPQTSSASSSTSPPRVLPSVSTRSSSSSISYAAIAGGSSNSSRSGSSTSASSSSSAPAPIPAIRLAEAISKDREDISLTMRDLRISPAPAPPVQFRGSAKLPPLPLPSHDDSLGADIESFFLGVDLVATLDSPFPESPKTPTPMPISSSYRTVGAVTFNTMRPLGTVRQGINYPHPKVFEGLHDAFGPVAVQVLNKRTHRLYNPDIEKLRRATVVPHETPLLRFHGSVEDENNIYAMSEIGGYNLIDYTAMLRSSQKLALPLLLDLSKRILRVVAEMHAWGICHKNLKPTKIFIRPVPSRKMNQTQEDDQDNLVVQIGGVGIAATNSAGMEIWGTPGWQAPELNLSPTGANSTSCDVFSCGMILASLLLRPQSCDSMLSHIESTTHALNNLKESDNPELWDLLSAMTHRDPAMRPSVEAASRHCALWPIGQRVRFFQTIIQEQTSVIQSLKENTGISDEDKIFLDEISSRSSHIVQNGWEASFPPHLRPPPVSNVYELLQHTSGIIADGTISVQDIYHPVISAFPKLFTFLYKTAAKYWTHKTSLLSYFVQ